MKKRKQSVILGSLFFIIVILVLAYLAMLRLNNRIEENPEESGIELYSLDTQTAVKLTIENEYQTISLVKESESWIVEGDENFPLEESKISSMLSVLEHISAVRSVVDKADDLKEYGLDKPKVTIDIELENGVSAMLRIGVQAPMQSGYYALVDDADNVYLMEDSYYSSFCVKKSDLMRQEEAIEIDSSSVTYLKTKNTDENYFEAVSDEAGSWEIKGAYEKPIKADAASLIELLDKYSNITFGECVEYNCKDASAYGITKNSKQIEIIYYNSIMDDNVNETSEKESMTYLLRLGNQNENGDYYVQREGSAYVYLLEEETANELMNVEAFEYINPYPITETVDQIEAIEIKQGSTITKLKLKSETKTDEDGKDSTKYVCTKNGNTWSYDSFSEFYASLSALMYQGEIEEDKIKVGSVYASITLKLSEGSKKIKFLTYDGSNYYQIYVDKERYFLVEMKEVEQILSLLN